MKNEGVPKVCYNCLFPSWDDPNFDLEREHTPPGGSGVCMALAVIRRLMEISEASVAVRAVNGKKIPNTLEITSQTHCRIQAEGDNGWVHVFKPRGSRISNLNTGPEED